MNMKELENVGGVEYLQVCCDSMVAFASLDFYINIVNDQSCLRKLLITIRDIDKKYHTEEINNINDFILQSEEMIKDATEKRRISQFKPTKDVAPEVELECESAESAAKAPGSKETNEMQAETAEQGSAIDKAAPEARSDSLQKVQQEQKVKQEKKEPPTQKAAEKTTKQQKE